MLVQQGFGLMAQLLIRYPQSLPTLYQPYQCAIIGGSDRVAAITANF